ncbi:hypothetical protein HPB47_007747 [Ixodes persulcatus]|uniref:Uncharacterized protein n=1 Tax=Ixodes persulcatus TaxID=34615 RepID=A0AC60P6K9_IXOPE|nr:hypothetical protein HPB47_007747 [Ixodes persulcatus]
MRRSEDVGLSVDYVTSMRLCGIVATRYGRPKTTCSHPYDNGRDLDFLADAPHLLKNLRGHLVREQKILVDAETVRKHNLQCNEVRLTYIKQVCEIVEKHDLKLEPSLKLKYLAPNHYKKMSLGPACALFDHSVASAIRLLVGQGKLAKEASTTAWFLQLVHQWFTLMKAPTPKMTLSREAETFLQDVIEVFTRIEIFDAGKSTPAWKPVQAGIIITISTASIMRDPLVKKRGLKYLLLSRFGQSALDNLFSTVRLKSPVPRARKFKYALRKIILAKFVQPSKRGSNQVNDALQLAEFISSLPSVLQFLQGVKPEPTDPNLSLEEQENLHYLSGYVARNVTNKNQLCNNCTASVNGTDKENRRLLTLTNYVDGKQFLCVPLEPVSILPQNAKGYF